MMGKNGDRVVKTEGENGRISWRVSVDFPRALYQMVLAGVSYLLMIAVMTLNVGYFLAVLGGIFLGEVLFGRFSAHNINVGV